MTFLVAWDPPGTLRPHDLSRDRGGVSQMLVESPPSALFRPHLAVPCPPRFRHWGDGFRTGRTDTCPRQHFNSWRTLVGGEVRGDAQTLIRGAASIARVQPGEITLADAAKLLSPLSGFSRPRPPSSRPIFRRRPSPAFSCRMCTRRSPRSSRISARRAKSIAWGAARPRTSRARHAWPTTSRCIRLASIGEDVVVGAGTVIHAGVHIMAGCRIGRDVTLFPNVVFYENTVIGDRSIIHAGAVIGAYGFGYHTVDGGHVRSAQLGNVEIGCDVEIGAGTTIDRGTYDATVIGDGTKIDNQVMIGHNCRLGRHNLICSQVGIAGSCTTGDYVVMAGQVGLSDHLHIGNRAILGAKAGVMNDVPDGAVFIGVPGDARARSVADVGTRAAAAQYAAAVEEARAATGQLAAAARDGIRHERRVRGARRQCRVTADACRSADDAWKRAEDGPDGRLGEFPLGRGACAEAAGLSRSTAWAFAIMRTRRWPRSVTSSGWSASPSSARTSAISGGAASARRRWPARSSRPACSSSRGAGCATCPTGGAVGRSIRTFVTRTQDRSDDTLMTTLIEAYADDGITFAPPTDFAPELLVKLGPLTGRTPTASQWKDIQFGWQLAKELGRAGRRPDGGRQRAGGDGRGGGRRARMRAFAAPASSVRRADSPSSRSPSRSRTCGSTCRRSGSARSSELVEAGGQVLAIEAGKTIIVDEAEVVRFAQQHRLTVVAVDPAQIAVQQFAA